MAKKEKDDKKKFIPKKNMLDNAFESARSAMKDMKSGVLKDIELGTEELDWDPTYVPSKKEWTEQNYRPIAPVEEAYAAFASENSDISRLVSAGRTQDEEEEAQFTDGVNPHEDETALDEEISRPNREALNVEQIEGMVLSPGQSVTLADFFKAFSDGTRLRILHALSLREMCVGELCELLGASQPAVSNHLRVLYRERIVKCTRRGKHVFYMLDDWHINGIISMALEHYNMDCPR